PEHHEELCPDHVTNQSQEVRAAPPMSLPAPLTGAEVCNCASAIQALLKVKIREIQSSPLLTPKEKAESVQNLMMKDWNDSRTKAASSKVECNAETERQRTTYHVCALSRAGDEAKKVLGCSHYQCVRSLAHESYHLSSLANALIPVVCRRKCKLQGKCCGKWYSCRFCHGTLQAGIVVDDNEDHPFDRYATETVSCMKCDTVQPIGQVCVNEACKCEFGRYYCEVCRFIDDDNVKDIYHCDKCKICRIGKQGLDIDYFHCDRCNACMSISLKKHKCVERSLESDCPICHAYMFTSTTPVMFLPCGHCMHVTCYEEYTLVRGRALRGLGSQILTCLLPQTNYICPLCSKSLGDMELYFASIDEMLEREQMPTEYIDYKSLIYCSDCERKSTTNFHFVYHKVNLHSISSGCLRCERLVTVCMCVFIL
ncbi:hypothetical protein BBJ28_00002766, partial [Nothophytophthora sp. Chile5]